MITYLMNLYINAFDSVFTKIFNVKADSPEQYGIMVSIIVACIAGYFLLDVVIKKIEA